VPYSRVQGVIEYAGTDTNDFEERRHSTQYQATNFYADYVKSFNQTHNFHFLAGYNYEQSVYKNLTLVRNGIVFEDVEDLALAIGDKITPSGGYEKWRIAGGFFRVNYNYKERYLLEVNGRYDGSSKFPDNSQWAFFPSVSVGWRISQEGFWNVDPKAVSNLKLRASYGSLGNGSIGAYQFSERFEIAQSDRIINGKRPQRTRQPNVVPKSLTWETATNGNIGLEIDALNNRLNFTGDVYRRWTKNMFTVGPSLPIIFGQDVPKGNFASLETTGFELSVSWNDKFNLASKPFHYNLRVTLANYVAKVTEYFNPEMNLSDYYTGQTIGEIWGYRVEGIFRSDAEIAASPSQSNIFNHISRTNHVGDLKFKKLDGDTSNEIWQGSNRVGDSGSKEIIGNKEPRYIYGITLGADWNGFFFSSLFQGVMKQQWYPSAECPFWGHYNRPYNDYPRWHENREFRDELQNFDAYFPKIAGYTARDGMLKHANDRYLQNVSYIRLKSLNFGYTIPAKISNRIGASDLRVYLAGENLWTWSPMYKLTRDIEVTNIYGSGSSRSNFDSNDIGDSGDGFNYPTLKTISIGLSITF
jgi:TonB-linked SusC/RagA family outer membrane protein